MNPVIKNIFAVIAGLFFGSAVNMGIIMLSGSLIPPPDGIDLTDMEHLKSSMHLFEPKHFISPFLAHALGTLVGALVAAVIVNHHRMKFAWTIGIFFLVGGIANVFILPAPTWFIALDLIGAYLPMAWLGGKLALSIKGE